MGGRNGRDIAKSVLKQFLLRFFDGAIGGFGRIKVCLGAAERRLLDRVYDLNGSTQWSKKNGCIRKIKVVMEALKEGFRRASGTGYGNV